ncbi:MAG: thioredoxin domain-containing protein [Caldilineaceae bacterium]|nr:thioredoxin domain-containing protein [Caldilineaceae bacterium]
MMLTFAACTFPLTPSPTLPNSSGTSVPTEQAPASTTVPPSDPTTPAETATPATADESATETQPVTTTVAPGSAETYKGIEVGFTAEGYPYRGSPDAPITMHEYSDYQCPFCNRYFVQTEPALDESYVRSGQVRVVFHDLPLVDLHPNAPPAHAAALCIGDQGAALYWNMHARLFQTQSEWNQLPDPRAYFAELATALGVDMAQYDACIASGEKEPIVAQRVAAAIEKGFGGTPSFEFVRESTSEAFSLVGAQPYDQFATMIDTLLTGGTPQTEEQAQGSDEIPFWATADGLKPDPAHPDMTMGGDFYRGNPDAKVVVIEFSDFQCPFCQRHNTETQPVLDEQFVDTGEVMWVFKHFPLTIHPQAPAAGVAAECAAQQGQFWEMHELLFATTQSWSIDDPNPILIDLAQQLGLDEAAFTTCLNSDEAAQRVQEDLEAGTPFVRGTPTFIVLYDGQGSIIPGALPAERFITILQEVLDSVN